MCQELASSNIQKEKTETEETKILYTQSDQPIAIQNTEPGVSGETIADQSKTSTENALDAPTITEHVEKKIDNKDNKFFSLTNFVKSFLNPFIHEFQEDVQAEKDKNETSDSQHTPNILSLVLPGNTTAENTSNNNDSKNGTDGNKKFKFQCLGKNLTANATSRPPVVEIVNGTVLIEMLTFNKNYTVSDCVLVLFYAPWCHFCAKTAPHYNAMARAFPQLEVLAVDVAQFSNLNARFGTVAVPNIMLFHISKSAVRFNHTERNFNTFIQFMKNVTGLDANSTVNVTESDYLGPVPSVPTTDTDYLLWLAWIFVIGCSGWMFVHSHYGQQSINRVRVLWQEHQHIE
ncbi:thioredoxin domain-containing protein 15-like [Gigantopelta aegis]|uniref:thioredoxin domain-containing protein 15-like n=1 Tax=Gigantopelta aegis TaxID=1735272 RepID=UPI001B88DBC2|nr:thioredoxin domain-containing protein 15-like [Gigantopelta aegis]